MIKQGYGRIVNMSSVSAKRGGGVFGGAHYTAAKAGILGFAKALAREVAAHGITVNSVAPGLIATDIRGGLESPERQKEMSRDIPCQRMGTPEEVAATSLFWLPRKPLTSPVRISILMAVPTWISFTALDASSGTIARALRLIPSPGCPVKKVARCNGSVRKSPGQPPISLARLVKRGVDARRASPRSEAYHWRSMPVQPPSRDEGT